MRRKMVKELKTCVENLADVLNGEEMIAVDGLDTRTHLHLVAAFNFVTKKAWVLTNGRDRWDI